MKMKGKPVAAGSGLESGYALGALFAVLSLICGILLYLAPGLSFKIADYMTHGTMQFTIRPFDLGGILIGAALWFIAGVIISVLHAKLCECCKTR